ncbi:hypothetical protein G647_05998 [Cladophialophora carrionii CBS 160.54]|uniref:Major facilitator superfamily (MFS) profile domain-containing protein n=1 Tax=Cladophialophora carrionii CBS 160.54 TaxID=1279043 RepID=V9D6M6_9EURO|nr:uncharacterized protein G647_05998 [Cladophialophora carrionii CBS 160.54]ETI21928.1 hypothetical protein G647_05998 [Cladophialophora carrionii CBS 160.54]
MAPGQAATDSTGRRQLLDGERQPLLQPSDGEPISSHDSHTQGGGNTPVPGDEVSETKSGRAWQHEDTFKLLSVIFDFFIMGVCQTAVGALIPDIERFYHLSDGPTASLFVAHMGGYLCATAVIQHLHLRLGRRGIALLAPLFRLSAAALLATGPSFNVALATYSLFGFGTGLADAGWCAWASSLPYANICQGMMHGAFSAGCVVGPIAALAVLNKGFEWYGFYGLAAALLSLELMADGLAFRRDTAAKYRSTASGPQDNRVSNPFRITATWMCGLFFFVYVGIESSFSDWIVLFMRRIRHADPLTASLSSSSFWAGMAVGRLLLGFVTQSFGLRLSISTYIVCSTILQILFRQITHPASSLVFLGLNGLFCGPLFPSGILLLATKLPTKGRVGAVAAAAAMGQAGGALAPLSIGLLADRFGISHLLDVVPALSTLMLVIWWVFSTRV